MSWKVILDYLSALEQNNNRDWFHQNKERYQQAKQSFEEFIWELMQELRKTDGSIPQMEPKDLTFKIMRDTRFSHDKSPYNPVFRAHIAAKGKLPIPVGYYLMIKPGDRSFLGGGLFADMFQDATARIRDAIAKNGEQWRQILSDPAFQEYFTVKGTALKKAPRGYDSGHPQAEYLKYKCWYVEYPVADQQLQESGFLLKAVDIYKRMQPFHAFLNSALEGFEMPKR